MSTESIKELLAELDKLARRERWDSYERQSKEIAEHLTRARPDTEEERQERVDEVAAVLEDYYEHGDLGELSTLEKCYGQLVEWQVLAPAFHQVAREHPSWVLRALGYEIAGPRGDWLHLIGQDGWERAWSVFETAVRGAFEADPRGVIEILAHNVYMVEALNRVPELLENPETMAAVVRWTMRDGPGADVYPPEDMVSHLSADTFARYLNVAAKSYSAALKDTLRRPAFWESVRQTSDDHRRVLAHRLRDQNLLVKCLQSDNRKIRQEAQRLSSIDRGPSERPNG